MDQFKVVSLWKNGCEIWYLIVGKIGYGPYMSKQAINSKILELGGKLN